MRKLILFLWLLVPVTVGAYHYGPGQDRIRADRAAEMAARAEKAARDAALVADVQGDLAAKTYWAEAVDAYTEAIELLPNDRVDEGRALRLELAKAQMFVSGLPEARRNLEILVEELTGDEDADADLLADARGALANAQYYTTWLMRLEGAPRDEWEPEIEASRQNYKLIAESATEAGDEKLAMLSSENVESAIRLARMDLSELQGLPLPSQ